ncbi:MAG: formate C-acetyltransferase/glycerol dehydratase family glycyl radical enzyme [Anaerolineaceae bacterium]
MTTQEMQLPNSKNTQNMVSMSAKVAILRESLLNTMPSVCVERARLVTEAYKAHEFSPIVLRRAHALAHVLENMTIYIQPGEIIVGNQASKPRAAPIFPEYSTDWIEPEIDEFSHRPADQFTVSPQVKRELLEDILPYWQGRTLYDQARTSMPPEVWMAQEIGVISGRGNITSGDGHIIVDIPRVLVEGLEGVIAQASQALEVLQTTTNMDSLRSKAFLEGVVITCQAAIRFARRYAEKAEELAVATDDPEWRTELLQIAEVCRQIPGKPARTFQEAVQAAWFIHLITQIESNGHSFSLGRFDQYTYPYFSADLQTGQINRERTLEMLEQLWLKLFSVIKIRPWSHTRYGIGYPTYQNVTIGGQTPDGKDATNELSYIVLETIRQTRLTQPNVSARYHSGTPDRFLLECARTIKLGFGMPAMKNDEAIIPALLEKGVSAEDAYNYAIVGCVEAAVPGKWGYRNTGMAFINLLKVLELAYNDGVDPMTGTRLCPGTGALTDFKSFQELFAAFHHQLAYYTWTHVCFDAIGDLALEEMSPDAFCSALVDDCIGRGKTVKEGGAVYDIVSGLQSGVANVANALMALKKTIYEEKSLTPEQIQTALTANFSGISGEKVRQKLLAAPKYGNDIEEVDLLAERILNDYLEIIKPYRTTRNGRGPIGCNYAGSTSNISANVPLGQPVCATPDGRWAGEPIAEGVSNYHGTDTRGPTAVMRSVTRLPTIKMLAQLLNLRLSPSTLATEAGLWKLVSLLRGFQALKGWHVQFNVVDSKTLLAAQENPDQYKDLVVRVAGYSALFVTLDKVTQDDIIQRTVHDL